MRPNRPTGVQVTSRGEPSSAILKTTSEQEAPEPNQEPETEPFGTELAEPAINTEPDEPEPIFGSGRWTGTRLELEPSQTTPNFQTIFGRFSSKDFQGFLSHQNEWKSKKN